MAAASTCHTPHVPHKRTRQCCVLRMWHQQCPSVHSLSTCKVLAALAGPRTPGPQVAHSDQKRLDLWQLLKLTNSYEPFYVST